MQNKLFLGVLVAAFVCPRSAGQSNNHPTTDMVKNTVDSVVLIVVSDDSGKEVALGSGFIVSADGKIITNYHVIKGAQRAVAKMSNGAYFPVESVLSTDTERDLAILKLAGKNLPFLRLADSDKVAVGEHVFAIGSPLGLQNSVSDGIISAIREEKPGIGWIQTTAPVSPGNSGGPLLREDGGVLGVITWGARMGQNLNFAAPANEVSSLLLSADHPAVAPVSLSGNVHSVERLNDVRKIAVASFGNTDAAGLVREKLINRLVSSGKVTVVDDPGDADAILKGVVGSDVYGRADTAAVTLAGADGRILWGKETNRATYTRSTSSSIADHLAKELLKELSK